MSLAPPGSPSGPNALWAALLGSSTRPKGYVHISFHLAGIDALTASHFIQPIINLAEDWLKYAENCWIVWGDLTATEWYQKFSPIEALKPCSILVVSMERWNVTGQLPQWAWDWLNKNRGYVPSGGILPPLSTP